MLIANQSRKIMDKTVSLTLGLLAAGEMGKDIFINSLIIGKPLEIEFS